MMCMFYGKWFNLGKDVQCLNLGVGFDERDPKYINKWMGCKDVINGSHIMHWSGPGKPWLIDGKHKHLWTPYFVESCFA